MFLWIHFKKKKQLTSLICKSIQTLSSVLSGSIFGGNHSNRSSPKATPVLSGLYSSCHCSSGAGSHQGPLCIWLNPPYYDAATTVLHHRDGISWVMSNVWSSDQRVQLLSLPTRESWPTPTGLLLLTLTVVLIFFSGPLKHCWIVCWDLDHLPDHHPSLSLQLWEESWWLHTSSISVLHLELQMGFVKFYLKAFKKWEISVRNS